MVCRSRAGERTEPDEARSALRRTPLSTAGAVQLPHLCHAAEVTEVSAVPPESRDWTFVIAEGCAECGFTPQPPDRTGERLRATIPTWRSALAGRSAPARPAPTVWSTVEYGCHVRDTCRLFRRRLELMLAEDDPEFANWDQDATAVDNDYVHQDSDEVAATLAAETQATATAFERIRPDQWNRTGRRSDGSTFTVGTLAVYLLHDVEHHVHDVSPA